MPLISVAQAARRLNVSPQRVHQRIADGSVYAVRVGSQWALDDGLLHRAGSRPGRPLSERGAWAVLALALDEVGRARSANLIRALGLSASEWSRARKRLSKILASDEPEQLLRAWLPRRAQRLVFRASPRDLADARADKNLLPSGLSHADSGMASPDVAEGYLARADLDAFVDRYLLIEAADGRGNVVLHVAVNRPEAVSPLLVAVDLAEHHGARESGRARDLVARLR